MTSFPRGILVTSSRESLRGCPQQVGRVGEDVTRMLRGNCCRGIQAYHRNSLTDIDEIWCGDAHWPHTLATENLKVSL